MHLLVSKSLNAAVSVIGIEADASDKNVST